MASQVFDQTQTFLAKHAPEQPMTPRDLAVALHVVMRRSGWERLDRGGVMAENQVPEISVFTPDGREMIISVREP
jgi:hypothetical protein